MSTSLENYTMVFLEADGGSSNDSNTVACIYFVCACMHIYFFSVSLSITSQTAINNLIQGKGMRLLCLILNINICEFEHPLDLVFL